MEKVSAVQSGRHPVCRSGIAEGGCRRGLPGPRAGNRSAGGGGGTLLRSDEPAGRYAGLSRVARRVLGAYWVSKEALLEGVACGAPMRAGARCGWADFALGVRLPARRFPAVQGREPLAWWRRGDSTSVAFAAGWTMPSSAHRW